METSKFTIGKNYQMRFICDSDLKILYTCISRTEKTAKFQRFGKSETISRRIRSTEESEYIVDGSYSMAPSIYAKHQF